MCFCMFVYMPVLMCMYMCVYMHVCMGIQVFLSFISVGHQGHPGAPYYEICEFLGVLVCTHATVCIVHILT